MKKSLLSLSFLLLFISGYAQDLKFNVHGKYTRPILREKLISSRNLSDLISGYPANWISKYNSVSISATCNSKTTSASSNNDILNESQILLLNAVDMCSDINIQITYIYENPVTGDLENKQLKITLTLIPDVEAEYFGGIDELINFLKKQCH